MTRIAAKRAADVSVGSRAAVAGRRMAQPVYRQLRKYPCVLAPTLRARSGRVIAQYFPGEVPPNVNSALGTGC
jgi:hypothetical protein